MDQTLIMSDIVPLKKTDYQSFLNLLAELTEVGDISRVEFENQIDRLNSEVFVIHDIDNQVIASATLFIERKFIHNLSSVGHIEDVIVASNHRNKGLGKRLINYLVNLAKERNCYKVILNCTESKSIFYEKCGFVKKEVEMVKYF